MLRRELEKHNLEMTDNQVELLDKFMEAVIETNNKFNLTAILDKDAFVKKHIIDSLLFFKFNDWSYETVADIGTGAGIPGVVLGIAKPETKFTLVDSNNKKVVFINEFAQASGLNNIKAIKSRAEELELKFDLITSRAVAPMPMILEVVSHLVKVGGKIILYKGRNLREELCERIQGEIPELGLQFEKITEYELENEGLRHFIEYKKKYENQDGYPRLFKDIKAKGLCS